VLQHQSLTSLRRREGIGRRSFRARRGGGPTREYRKADARVIGARDRDPRGIDERAAPRRPGGTAFCRRRRRRAQSGARRGLRRGARTRRLRATGRPTLRKDSASFGRSIHRIFTMNDESRAARAGQGGDDEVLEGA
jgi:hypothetical protein